MATVQKGLSSFVVYYRGTSHLRQPRSAHHPGRFMGQTVMVLERLRLIHRDIDIKPSF
ncbi:MAG: hypothetical protein R6V02_04920 [Candidatus Aminicenantes bacterium]